MFKNKIIMKRTLKLFVVIFSLSSVIYPQNDLYIPRNILKAYEKGTRSFDGKPGSNYWQNSSDYKIKVSVEPETKLLKGSQSVVYYNNSPDTLKEITFNIIQDLNKKGAARNFPMRADNIGDGVKVEKLSVNGESVDTEAPGVIRRFATTMTVNLPQPLAPGSDVNFEIEWNFSIPEARGFPRMGAYDSTTFFVAYWFPHIAVYDDIDGWDQNYHNGEQEFYNDFSNFEVEITVPNTFAVWATGILQNPEEVFNKKYLERYKAAWTSDDVINIVTAEEAEEGGIYRSENQLNTWKYKADYVPDFTFGMSDHYLWDGVSFVVDKKNNRRVYVAAAYNKASQDFYEVAEIARKSIDYFSNVMPAVPFPYPCLTVFNGSGGMEFPMIINDGSASTHAGTVGVTSHEIAHQYFPFYMGTNEKKYGWMDEGMAVFLPFDFQESEGGSNPRLTNASAYERFAGNEMEMQMMIPSYLLRGWTLRVNIYVRPGLAYDFLHDLMGRDLFLKCLHEYMRRWNGKHPMPFDFFFTFNEVSGKDLNWYWEPWFFENGYPDLAIKDASYNDDTIEIVVEKVGNIPTPVSINVSCEDDSIVEFYETAAVWEGGNKTAVIKGEIKSRPVLITLGTNKIPDSNRDNNYYNFTEATL
jgi:hypothetical protein